MLALTFRFLMRVIILAVADPTEEQCRLKPSNPQWIQAEQRPAPHSMTSYRVYHIQPPSSVVCCPTNPLHHLHLHPILPLQLFYPRPLS